MRGLISVLLHLLLMLNLNLQRDGEVLGSPSSMQKEKQDILLKLESNLLNMFGMRRRPRPGKNVVIPQYMLELYRQQTGQDLDTVTLNTKGKHTRTANTVRSFTHQESPLDQKSSRITRLKFNLKSVPKEEVLKAAELRFTLPDSSDVHRVELYDVIRLGRRAASGVIEEPITRLLDVRTVGVGVERQEDESVGAVNLDVLPAVERWLRDPSSNYGVLVKVAVRKGSGGGATHVRLKRDVGATDAQWQRQRPLLFTYTDDGKATKVNKRTKRSKHSNKKHRRKHRRSTCKRRELYVDFSDVGWNDWIVAPAGYNAYYCHGECPVPLPDHLNATNHAIVQNLVNSVNPSMVPTACCVPTELSQISMLYLDEDKQVVLKNYQDMVVEGCGCR